MTSNLYSVDSGTDQAEYVGMAFILALDQFLTKDSCINYASAGASLLAAIETGNFREGRRANNNSSLSAICNQVWGLLEGGRLSELSSMAKSRVREFVGLFRIATGSYTGYSLTRFASLHELSNLMPAIVGAGKMDKMNIDALYNYIKSRYCVYSGDFVIGINQHLYNDESRILTPPLPMVPILAAYQPLFRPSRS